MLCEELKKEIRLEGGNLYTDEEYRDHFAAWDKAHPTQEDCACNRWEVYNTTQPLPGLIAHHARPYKEGNKPCQR